MASERFDVMTANGTQRYPPVVALGELSQIQRGGILDQPE